MATDTPKARRLSLSEVLELVLSRGTGDRSSVTLTRNAKGDTQIEVTVRTGDTGDVLTAADAAAEAQRLYDSLREAYPSAAPAS